MRNLPVIDGLCRVGRHALAAELIGSTIKAFTGNYTEYVAPSTGSGEGVQRYGWSASQYIQTIIEYLFGVHWNAVEETLTITPILPGPCLGRRVALENLQLTAVDRRVSVVIEQSEPGMATMALKFQGSLPARVVVALPHSRSVQAGGAPIPLDVEIPRRALTGARLARISHKFPSWGY